ncbi:MULTISPECIES: hypothetical protein [Rhodanobacter]|uniref:hypothetical protein n=1 Tax=Rhodanobacter TaxID=75309 RepID=UPI00047FB60C|nr:MULTISPECIES: hypothetical protein [Rhodanobacter]TAN15574.1 MAG: hypothetical protein EPN35_13325 [Rhodanobacter sp.]UJJ53187.1 hypothetical protein LRK53_09210 [Rhodanobacter thiooxydans]
MESTLLDVSLKLLAGLGVTSVAGFLSLYAAWISFPPELVVDAVIDKSKKFNSESRIKIKNSGKLPALAVQADAENVCARIGGLTMRNCGFFNGPHVFPRLSGGEAAEISVSPGIGFGQAMQISEFSYRLTLIYRTKLLFLGKSFKKSWGVELRNFEDGYAWNVTPA